MAISNQATLDNRRISSHLNQSGRRVAWEFAPASRAGRLRDWLQKANGVIRRFAGQAGLSRRPGKAVRCQLAASAGRGAEGIAGRMR